MYNSDYTYKDSGANHINVTHNGDMSDIYVHSTLIERYKYIIAICINICVYIYFPNSSEISPFLLIDLYMCLLP